MDPQRNKLTRQRQTVVSVDDALRLIQMGKSINDCFIADTLEVELYTANHAQLFYSPGSICVDVADPDDSTKSRIATWDIPDHYMSIDLEAFLLSKCESDIQRDRVMYELALYRGFELEIVLKLCMFLVDTMRENKIVWGVGRGSSVASYILYLIGIHKVDSILYDLDIHEFLK